MQESGATPAPVRGLQFLYLQCTSIDSMRVFYSTILGLDEFYFSSPEQTVGYRCGELQLTVTQHPSALADLSDDWATQPGWTGGNSPKTSWSIVFNEAQFAATVDRVQAASTPAFVKRPEWVGYWSFPIKDPMGNTVELVWSGVSPEQ